MKIRLADRFNVHASFSERILQDVTTGAKRLLDEDQYEFVLLLDGELDRAGLLAQYDDESLEVVGEFLATLQDIGAITESDDGKGRSFIKTPVPDIRLNAVHLEAFGQCNMRCAHCYQGELYRNVPGLSWERLERLGHEMHALQVDNVAISGGEPFLNPLTLEIARFYESLRLRVNAFFTNGLALDERIVTELKALRSRPTVFLSLDAIRPDGMAFRGFTGAQAESALKGILRNLELLMEAGIPVVVNTVMTKENEPTLDLMYDLLSRTPIKSWRIGFPKRAGFFRSDAEEHELSWEEMAQTSYGILERHLAGGKPFHLQIEYLYREELLENLRPLEASEFVCDYEGKRESCCIKPNGDVVSCAYCVDSVIGNIHRASLADVWYSGEMHRVKNLRIADIDECRDCAIRSLCATGCRANAAFLGGHFEHSKDEYACKAVTFFVQRIVPLLTRHGVAMDPSIAGLLAK